ncbi:hypothetical protein FB446DRAFT_795997 [Lentinula raphanica]|nr:hypothetical protein FB446DRAFT_795997 [Lentinula raphanica]
MLLFSPVILALLGLLISAQPGPDAELQVRTILAAYTELRHPVTQVLRLQLFGVAQLQRQAASIREFLHSIMIVHRMRNQASRIFAHTYSISIYLTPTITNLCYQPWRKHPTDLKIQRTIHPSNLPRSRGQGDAGVLEKNSTQLFWKQAFNRVALPIWHLSLIVLLVLSASVHASYSNA